MTAIDPSEVIAELEAECACVHEDCVQAKRERDTARNAAVVLEAEGAAVRVLLRTAYYMADSAEEITHALWNACDHAIGEWVRTGSLSDEAFALAQRLGESS